MQRNRLIATLACGAIALAGAVIAFWRMARASTYLAFDTMFGKTRIYQVEDDAGDAVRLLEVGGIVQSGAYVDDERCYDLVFDYLKRYDEMFDAGIAVRRVCVLGCGGYDYPEHLIAHYPDVVVDAVEIDPAITALARRYFFLDRLVEEFETERSGRLNLITADALDYLLEGSNETPYDAIVNDTFDAGAPPAHLTTPAFAQAVHDRLVPGGLYLTNIVSPLEGPDAGFLHKQVALLESTFASVNVRPCATDDFSDADNVIIVAVK